MNEYLYNTFETTLKKWIYSSGIVSFILLILSITGDETNILNANTLVPLTVSALLITFVLIMIWAYLYPNDLTDRELNQAINQLKEKGYLIEYETHEIHLNRMGKVFLEHIDTHLKDDEKIICTICNKTVDRIYAEYLEEKGVN
jgi:hypothetical protein